MIDQIAKKIAKNIGIIKRISYLLSHKVLLMLYYSVIYPYLSYCNFIWASIYTTIRTRLMILQKRIIRIISGSKYLSPPARPRFVKLGLLNLNQITSFQLLVFMYKAMNNLLLSDFLKITNLNNSDQHSTRNGGATFCVNFKWGGHGRIAPPPESALVVILLLKIKKYQETILISGL